MAAPTVSTRQAVAVGLGTLVVAEVIVSWALAVSVGWDWHEASNTYVVTNGLMGLAFGVCGSVIARHRPGNPIGWLFVADGIGHATSALAVPLTAILVDHHAPLVAQRLGSTVFAWSWPWSIGLFLPLALMLFPDGRLPSPRWRPVAIAIIATSPLFTIELGTDPVAAIGDVPLGYLTLGSHDALNPIWTASELRTLLALVVATSALVVRYRRADSTVREQLQWLLLATMTAVVLIVPWSFVAGTPIVVLFAIPLIPISVALAIVRHQLLDIRFVVSRAVAWLVLSLGVVASYVLLISLLDTFISTRVSGSIVATVIIALLVTPVLPRLQRLVDRAMYGDRNDPVRVVSRVGDHLHRGSASSLGEVADSIREALRVPYVAVWAEHKIVGEAGALADGQAHDIPLTYGSAVVGRLSVGLRPGERKLTRPDQEALRLVASSVAVAVHAITLAAALKVSRERLVAAREEERRRLRRDLHDGLGPLLTGLALTADAAANLQLDDPKKTSTLLQTVRSESRTVIADVRRLVDNLRPPALDQLGLVGALKQRADQLSMQSNGRRIDLSLVAPDDLPTLPAALEVATYRIATEALTNVVRHSKGSMAEVTLTCGDQLEVQVIDNGASIETWCPGVGLQGMRERADELGGRFEAGPSTSGGRVYASFPLGAV